MNHSPNYFFDPLLKKSERIKRDRTKKRVDPPDRTKDRFK